MAEETEPKKKPTRKPDVLSFDDPETAAKFYNTFFYFYDGLNQEQKNALATAAGEHRGQDQLDDQTKLVYTAGMVILLQEYRRPNTFLHPDYKEAIARRLNVSLKKLNEWEQDIIEEYDREQSGTAQDEQPYLFPMEPDAEPSKKPISPDDFIPRVLLMAQRDGYNRIRGITPKNSKLSLEEVQTEHGGKMEHGVKMERVSRKGDRASVTIRFEPQDEARIQAIVKKWRVSAKMLMDYAVIKLTAQNNYIGIPKRGKGDVDAAQIQAANRLVKFPLEEWCKMRGIPDTKASLDHERQTVIEDCQTLLYTTLEWEERRKDGKRKSWRGLNPFPFAEVKNSEVKIEISTTLAAYLLTSPVMPYRPEFLRISNRAPNAYLLATKLAELCNINGHRKAKPSYIVSVSALLDATDYPTKEKVQKDHAGRYAEYIINPFIKALGEIEAVSSLKWEFCQEGGNPLTEEMQPDKKIDDFLSAYIRYNFTDEQAFENLEEIQ